MSSRSSGSMSSSRRRRNSTVGTTGEARARSTGLSGLEVGNALHVDRRLTTLSGHLPVCNAKRRCGLPSFSRSSASHISGATSTATLGEPTERSITRRAERPVGGARLISLIAAASGRRLAQSRQQIPLSVRDFNRCLAIRAGTPKGTQVGSGWMEFPAAIASFQAVDPRQHVASDPSTVLLDVLMYFGRDPSRVKPNLIRETKEWAGRAAAGSLPPFPPW